MRMPNNPTIVFFSPTQQQLYPTDLVHQAEDIHQLVLAMLRQASGWVLRG
jgi:hypothetical protein